MKLESRGEEGNSPKQGLHKYQNEPQLEGLNTTQINIHQTTETAANNVSRTEDSGEHRPQQTEMIGENRMDKFHKTTQMKIQEAQLRTT